MHSKLVEEINLALHNGSRKMYGDFAGISNAVMFTWLQNYTSSSLRAEALKKQREFLNPPPKILTPAEQIKIIHDACLQGFEEYKTKGHSLLINSVSYDYLDSLNIFQWAKGRKFEFIRQAQEVLKIEHQNDLEICKDSVMRIDILSALEEVNNPKAKKVLSRAKTIALEEYFKCLVDVQEELNDKINQ